MLCRWCHEAHPSSVCPHRVSIEEALDILGGLIAFEASVKHRDGQKQYWLDGRLTTQHRVITRATKWKIGKRT